MAERVLIDITELSKQLGVSLNTLYAWVNQRRIPYVKMGRLLRFKPDAIEKWIAEREVEVGKLN